MFITVGEGGPVVIEELTPRSRQDMRQMSRDPGQLRRRFFSNRPRVFDMLFAAEKPQKGFGDHMVGAVPFGFIRTTVEVPEGPPDEMVDLGNYQIDIQPHPKLQDPAPAFDVAALVGDERIRLSDYEGRWLVLMFWHSGSLGSASEMELNQLAVLWPEFESNSQLALAIIALDETPEKARASVKNGPVCAQGYAGGWRTSRITKDYGVIAVPTTFLIDPQGKIAGYNLLVAQLGDVLDKVVALQRND
jgi:peroxiredoxin